jgi:bZIP-type transcription factor MBZ1
VLSVPAGRVSLTSRPRHFATNICAEYIGQLEGEVAAKVDENSALRTENQQLREENNRLTDLTRMLLSSQSFSGFLQELSQSGLPSQPQRPNNQQAMPERAQAQPQQQHQRKDVNPNDATRQISQQQPQVGMALMPETNVDLSLFSGSWNSGVNANDFQVFAVTDLPEDPVLDLSKLSEKPTASYTSTKSESPKDLPCLPEIPEPVKALKEAKADHPTIRSSTPLSSTMSPPIKSIVAQPPTSTISSTRDLEVLCAELEESCERLAVLLPRV